VTALGEYEMLQGEGVEYWGGALGQHYTMRNSGAVGRGATGRRNGMTSGDGEWCGGDGLQDEEV